MRRIGTAERRARLGVRHRLAAPGAGGLAEVARSLVALHATDPASVFLAAWARLRDPQVRLIERELYDERRVLRDRGVNRGSPPSVRAPPRTCAGGPGGRRGR